MPGAEAATGRGFPIRIAASAALLLYACLAWGSGIDRLSVTSPALERLVPAPLRAQADRSAAAVALAQGDSARALANATQALLHDPVDPLSASLFGSAEQYRGNAQAADAAFRVSAQRGWRDRLTQLYWYAAALQTGDAERAALRADALLRSDPYFAAEGALLEPLEANPAGRAILARRLAENPTWGPAYLSRSSDAAQLRLKSEIAVMAARQNGGLACATPRKLVEALSGAGLRGEAERVWRAACGGKALANVPEGGLFDSGFDALAAGDPDAPPFGWHSYASGDVAIEPVTGGGNTVLNLRNTSAVTRLVLSQALALAPGDYRVTVKSPANARLAFSLDCGGHPKRPAQTGAAEAQVLTAASCDGQVLGLWLRPGSGEVTIDDIAIAPVR